MKVAYSYRLHFLELNRLQLKKTRANWHKNKGCRFDETAFGEMTTIYTQSSKLFPGDTKSDEDTWDALVSRQENLHLSSFYNIYYQDPTWQQQAFPSQVQHF